ncbi:hypothetical protein, partial [Paraburkholderia sp. Ac-20347]|uniref:hypothetical protein n=1 Tax=Paraburkholderia sp. Ac-20347 TaxID=2703892 RepID=UPI001980793F
AARMAGARRRRVRARRARVARGVSRRIHPSPVEEPVPAWFLALRRLNRWPSRVGKRDPEFVRRSVTKFTSGNNLTETLPGIPKWPMLRRDNIPKKEKIQSGKALAAKPESRHEVRPVCVFSISVRKTLTRKLREIGEKCNRPGSLCAMLLRANREKKPEREAPVFWRGVVRLFAAAGVEISRRMPFRSRSDPARCCCLP